MAETKYMFGGDITQSMPASIHLGGDSDDYYQVDAAAADMANDDTTGALMAWVMQADDTSTVTVLGFGDKNVVEFIELNIEAGLLTCRCTDNTTAQFVTQADGDELEKHKWYHVAVVQRADGTGVHLFLNGKERFLKMAFRLEMLTIKRSPRIPFDDKICLIIIDKSSSEEIGCRRKCAISIELIFLMI